METSAGFCAKMLAAAARSSSSVGQVSMTYGALGVSRTLGNAANAWRLRMR